MDKKDYIVRQLRRTHNKRFENYVITRIWHLLDNLDIKIITQQYIVRPSDDNGRKKGYALADLYFPQFNLIVEVDEEFHLGQQIMDKKRENDIVNAVNFKILRIDTSGTIESIHERIDEVVRFVKELSKKDFKRWDYTSEFDSEQYIDKGYIDALDNALFLRQVDAYNCFGCGYKGIVQKSCVKHKYIDNASIWCPKLYDHGEWENKISFDESTIYERNKDEDKNRKQVIKWIENERHVRYVFAQSKDNIGRTLYRFKGEYTLNEVKTRSLQKAVWERTNTRVKTIKI